MKKCLSVLLVVALMLSSFTILVHAEIVSLADTGAETSAIDTGAGSVESAITWAINIANDDSHGYSQSRRTGPDYDCSSFVSTAFKQAGFNLTGEENTGTMKNAFVNAGFTWIPASSISGFPSSSSDLKRGDVLLANGHTALYIGDNQVVHARYGTYDKYDEGHPGDQNGKEILVTTYGNYNQNGGWQGVLRYNGINPVDLGTKFYANIVATESQSKDIAPTGIIPAKEDIDLTGTGNSNPNALAAIKDLQQKNWYKPGSNIGKTQCYGFAAAVFEYLFGKSMGYQADNYTEIYTSTMTEVGRYTGVTSNANIKSLLLKAYPGDIIQYASTAANPHTAVIQAVDDTGITLYHAYGGSVNGYWTVHVDFVSWANVPTINGFIGSFTNNSHGLALYHSKNYEELYGGGLSYLDLGTKFYANIVPTSANGSFAVTAKGANTNGTNVSLETLDYSDAQKWFFERQSDNSYKITNVQKNKCLDVDNYGTANGTNIQLWSSNDSTAQRWYLVKNGNGYWFVPKCNTASAMDIKGGNLSSGVNIQEYKQNNSDAQRFTINKIYNIAYDANGGTGSIASSSVSYNQKFTIKENAFTKEGYRFAGYYYVNRKSDNTWFVAEKGWVKVSAYQNDGLYPRHYDVDSYYYLNSNWTNGAADNDTFTFYPQWKCDNPALQFYGNYSGFNYIIGGSFDTITSSVYPHGTDNVYTLTADSSNRLNNQNSMKIVGKSAGNTANDVRFYTDTARSIVNSDSAGDNKRMTLGFWAKSSVDNVKAYFRWGNISTTKSITLSKSWQFFSINMTKNPYASPELCFYFDKAGTFYMNSPTLVDGATSASSHESETVGTVAKTQNYTYGSQYGWLPTPEREGYTFEGWFTAKQGGTQITEDTDVYENEMRVYAQWSKDISFTPIKTVESNGHKYELYDNAMGWEQAESFCESLGGHLITINSAAEQSLAYQLIKGRMNFSWIGVKFYTDEGRWRWVTGDSLAYTNWAADNEGTNNTTEYYAIMYPYNYGTQNIAGMWADCNGADAYRSFYGWHNANFICEYDSIFPDYIELNEDELNLSVGETYKLEANIGPEGANNRITWSSDDEDIVTVDDNGVVSAISEGKAWISARTVNGLMTRCEVTVTGSIIYPEEIELSAYAMELYVDETEQLYAIVEPEGASQDIIWYSEDESIATVDDNGLIRAKGVGTTWIHAQTADESIVATCTVIVLQTDIDPDHIEWNGFTGYIKEDGTICISGYTGDETDLVIPSEIDGVEVTEIEWIEGLDFIESVIIPETVRTIGYNSFHHCSNLRDVTIMGAESIEVSAFMMCSNLENVTLPETLKTIHYGAFVNCPKLTGVIIPNSVTCIEKAAFGFVLELCEDGFAYDVVPSDDYTVYGYAGSAAEEYAEKNGFSFVAVNEYEYRILDDDTVEITMYNGRDSQVVIPAELDGYKVKQIGSFAFSDCVLISTIVIPNTVTDIGFGAFSDCSALNSITIPNSVTTIGESAFRGCLSLQDIVFPDSVTYVGWGAISRTPWLDSQPDGMVYVGKAAYKLKGICPEEVSIKEGTVSISSCAFEDCYALTKVDLPSTLESIDSYAFRNCSSLASIDVPDSVAFVGCNAFSDTAWLDAQPEGLIYVGKNAYLMKGNSPKKVTIKDGTVSISDFAFANKSDLEEVILPNTLLSIGWQSFYDCERLKNVSIPNSVTSIDKYAFYDCPSLTSVTIPKSVTIIGEMAFGYVFGVDYNGSLVRSSPAGDDYPVDGFTIYGYKKTTAEQYATENDFIFIALDEEVSYLLGDTDGDGKVTILDATAIQRHLASLPTTAYNGKAADADEDGKVTILDATAIQRHLASLPTNQNIGKQIN